MKRRLKAGKMRNSGFRLNVFTDDECHEIHLATLEILKDTGVYCESKQALQLFDGGGCMVDAKNKVVKFPNWVVEDAICSAPSTFYCFGRRPADDVVLEDNRVTFANSVKAFDLWILTVASIVTRLKRILKKPFELSIIWNILIPVCAPCAPTISTRKFKRCTTPRVC